MPFMRILLLSVAVIGLGILAGQNWLPMLSITFLGMKTQTLPLAVWILMALFFGILSSFCLQLLSYLSRRTFAAQISPPAASKQPKSSVYAPKTAPTATQNTYSDVNADVDNFSDWVDADEEDIEENTSDADDWEERESTPSPTQVSDIPPKSTNYEVRRAAQSSSHSGSVYSYSYRQPKDSGVGKSEAVYDADYRVITPPYRQTPKNEDDWESKQQDEDDWGFEDDEFEDNRGDKSPK